MCSIKAELTKSYLLNVFTVDPVYSEWIGAAESVHLRRVFTINVFNLTINERLVRRNPFTISEY